MVELAELFRRSGPAYRAPCADRLPTSHLGAMAAIAPCRPEALGGPVSPCTACGEREYSSHSCTHRHGPTCHNDATTPWVAPQRELLLPVPSCLVTLTLPEARRPVARSHQPRLSPLLLQTSAAALQALALAPTYRGGPVGMIGVLPPWTRAMASHPPIHALVPGGALSPDGATWLTPRSAAWLVPVPVLSALFRGTFQAALTTTGLLPYVPPQVWHTGWMTHGHAAGTGTAVLASCAPSRSRSAMTKNRLEQCEDGPVTVRVTARPRPA